MKTIKDIIDRGSWFNKKIKVDKNSEYLGYGYTMVPNIFMHSQLNTNDKIVYISLLMFSFHKDSCFPSLKTLCILTGLSKPTIIKCVKSLSKKSFISIENNLGSSNNYIINLTFLNTLTPPIGFKGENDYLNNLNN